MSVIDIIILVAIAIGLAYGGVKGFVAQLASILGIVAGLFVARALYRMAGEWLAPQIGTSVTMAQIISFIAIWVLVPFVLYLVANMLTRVIKAVHLGAVNRLLGAVVGGLIALIWVGVFVQVIQYIDPDGQLIAKEAREASEFYQPMQDVSSVFFDDIKEASEKILKQ